MTATNQIQSNFFAVMQINTFSMTASTMAWAGNNVGAAYASNMTVTNQSTGRGYEINVPMTGAYLITVNGAQINATGTVGWTDFQVQVAVNGTTNASYGYYIGNYYAGSATYGSVSIANILDLTAGQTINVEYFAGPTASWTIYGTLANSIAHSVMVQYLGPALTKVV